jgi:hypothetical protein
MPRAKGQHDVLEPGLRFFLAHGRTADLNEDPEVPHGLGSGTFEGFQLWGRALRYEYSHEPALIAELQELWWAHADEIREACRDEEPWIATFLRTQTIPPGGYSRCDSGSQLSNTPLSDAGSE